MSGRIWVVEVNEGTRAEPQWRVAQSFDVRAKARRLRHVLSWSKECRSFGKVRVVQYVRQGGAR